MIEPQDVSYNDLKGFRKATQEKLDCAIDSHAEVTARFTLQIIDEEFVKRGYDPKKLFKLKHR